VDVAGAEGGAETGDGEEITAVTDGDGAGVFHAGMLDNPAGLAAFTTEGRDVETVAAGDSAGAFQVGKDGSLSGKTYCIGPGSGSDGFVFHVGVVESPDGTMEV
jgi:hypothetical protein